MRTFLISILCVAAAACSSGDVGPGETKTPDSGKDSCAFSEFTCGDKSCVSRSVRCDQTNDCSDNSDEAGCPAVKDDECTRDQFTCGDKTCVSRTKMCNDKKDCSDNSDEKDCPEAKTCKADQFTCNDKSCISKSVKVCNGTKDCSDGEDEASCPDDPKKEDDPSKDDPAKDEDDKDEDDKDTSTASDCPAPSLLCGSTCVPPEMICDKQNDCTGGEDEAKCDETCTAEQFTCGDGSCIPKVWECDGQYADCPGFEDEAKCDLACIGYECINDACIPNSAVCDNTDQCDEGEDEAVEVCDAPGQVDPQPKPDDKDDEPTSTPDPTTTPEPTEEVCPSPSLSCSDICIPPEMLCDGESDCPNEEDEESCSARTCADDEFSCGDGTCIPTLWHCDGLYQDCADGRDEGCISV